MEAVVSWKALIDLIEPHYPKTSSKGGRLVAQSFPRKAWLMGQSLAQSKGRDHHLTRRDT